MVAYCDVRLAKEGVIWLRPRSLRGLNGGAIRAAASTANVALGTHLLISSQAVAVPMEETLAFGADDWKGSNADGTGAPGADGPRVHLDVPALRRRSRRCRAGWAAPLVEKGGCAHPIAHAGYVGPESRICVRRLHLLAGLHVKVPDRCLRRGSCCNTSGGDQFCLRYGLNVVYKMEDICQQCCNESCKTCLLLE